jgi:Uma2 family endonuclease
MITAVKTKLTFSDFLDQYPEENKKYEFVQGEIIEMRSTREHDDKADFIADNLKAEIKRLNLNYVVKTNALIQTTTKKGIEQGRIPDVSVINKDIWLQDRSSYSALTQPIQLAVEVVSTNWDDDYLDKLDEYQRLGIKEYWIIDYLAIAGREYLGKPKLPTIFVYMLQENNEYKKTMFRDEEMIISSTFPELKLTPNQIFKS